jgi:hypothetical protein
LPCSLSVHYLGSAFKEGRYPNRGVKCDLRVALSSKIVFNSRNVQFCCRANRADHSREKIALAFTTDKKFSDVTTRARKRHPGSNLQASVFRVDTIVDDSNLDTFQILSSGISQFVPYFYGHIREFQRNFEPLEAPAALNLVLINSSISCKRFAYGCDNSGVHSSTASRFGVRWTFTRTSRRRGRSSFNLFVNR